MTGREDARKLTTSTLRRCFIALEHGGATTTIHDDGRNDGGADGIQLRANE